MKAKREPKSGPSYYDRRLAPSRAFSFADDRMVLTYLCLARNEKIGCEGHPLEDVITDIHLSSTSLGMKMSNPFTSASPK